MRKFSLLLAAVFLVLGVQAQTARLQIIHNSPSPTVVNGQKLLDGFAFREATEFLEVPAGVELEVGVAVSPSSDPSEIIATFPVTLLENVTHVAIANGVVGNPNTPFGIELYAGWKTAPLDPNGTELLVIHGSPDAPAVDVAARGIGDIVTDLAFNDIVGATVNGAFQLPAIDVTLDISPAGSDAVVASFQAPLSALAGTTAVVFASGYLGQDPGFGLFVALPNGDVLPLSALTTSRLQIIHNSPEPTVDIWVNNQPFLTGVDFRTATPFVDVPGNTDLEIGIAPSPSSDPSDIIYTLPANLLAGETFVAMAAGVVGNMNTPFGISVFAAGREVAADPANVDLLVFHGSPDAPAVDVRARNVGTLIPNLAFNSFTADYLSVPADRYILDIAAAGTDPIVASFEADLSGIAGASAVVFASGYLGQDPSFGLFAALADGQIVPLPAIQAASVQIIHNSPSPTVDIWVNDQPFLTDFAFRDATPFVEVPAGVTLNIGIAVSPSSSPSDIIATFPVTLTNGENYQVIANGVVGNMMTPFNLEVLSMARLRAVEDDEVDIIAFHGSPDAPAVDIAARNVVDLVTNLSFAEAQGYLSVPADRYILDISAAGTDPIVASFEADLSGLAGQSATVVASGYLGQDPAFGLFAVLADGTVVPLPGIEAASVQIIHNSPSPTVDIWVNDQPFLTDFAFRDATPFVEVPAGVTLNIGIAVSPSSSPSDIIATFPVTLTNGENYQVIANGVVGNMMTPFNLEVLSMARLRAVEDDEVDIIAFHGSPDAPAVDIAARNVVDLVTNLSFAEAQGYLSVPADRYILDISAAGTDPIVASFEADLSVLAGQSATVVASGYLGQDPAFGLFAVLADGTVVPLPAIQAARLQIIHNSPSPTVDIWVNDQPFLTDVAFRDATPFVEVPAGVTLNVGVAPSPSSSPNDIIATFPVDLVNGETYIAMAHGIVGDMTTPFDIAIFDQAREAATNPVNVDLLVFHGSPNAPTVDVTVGSVQTPVVDNLDYGTFQGYLSVPAGAYELNITPANDNSNNLFTYNADVTSLASGAATVFASGFLGQSPEFGLWVALADGTTFPLSPITSTLNPVLGELAVWPNPVTDVLTLTSQAGADTRVTMTLMDMLGRPIQSQNLIVGPAAGVQQMDVRSLQTGIYYLQLQPEGGAPSTLTVIKQ